MTDFDNSPVYVARKKYVEATEVDNLISNLSETKEDEEKCWQLYQRKFQLFLESAKFYLQAVNDVEEENLKYSLIYLANNSSAEAAKVKKILLFSGGKSLVSSKEEIIKEQQREKDYFLYSQRILAQARANHTPDVPMKQKTASSQEIVRDLLSLEEKIEQIGLRRSKPETSTNNQSSLKESAMAQSTHLSSQLGESFMVLGGGKTIGGGHTSQPPLPVAVEKPEHNPHHPAHQLRQRKEHNKDLNLSIMELPRVEQLQQRTIAPTLGNTPKTSSTVQTSRHSTYSMDISTTSTDSKDTTVSQYYLTSQNKNEVLENVNKMNAMNTTDSNSKIIPQESINRLLKTVETLSKLEFSCFIDNFPAKFTFFFFLIGDENLRLEEENRRVMHEMAGFREVRVFPSLFSDVLISLCF
jgi:hypothetical protein